jgi:hypothetical protein
VADPDELRGTAATLLAQHVRACAECRERAATILAESAALADAITAVTAAHQPMRVQKSRRRRWLAGALLPLAAAAALLVFVMQDRSASDDPLPPILMPVQKVAEVPVVNAQPGRNVAVMRTNNPKITVVWYY